MPHVSVPELAMPGPEMFEAVSLVAHVSAEYSWWEYERIVVDATREGEAQHDLRM